MATQQKVWIDGRGQEVPSSYVSKYDKARDRAVRRVVAGAQRLRGQIEAFMADAVATMDGLAGIKEDLGKRGNFSARSFDALLQGAFLLKQMIEAAFKVDRLGFLPRSEVAKLLSYKVGDAGWNEGADILRQAQTTERGKQYLTVETRRSLNHDFTPIRLDVADCWPREEAVLNAQTSADVEAWTKGGAK